ncbi:TerC family protein [Phenylobacterium aquaticum]|uniref:TerC family protein n=1 Tax=Phenylobacterium aquaticum TaxID=1763816 RepID=UPI001F5C98DD|nr:TerC family protein [Phenylobacterium aquaticum]MCI3135252.1 TerC family protein [Phenylobacterium aquaticum]
MSLQELALGEVLGAPAWMWASFMALVAGLLALDLGVLHRRSREIGVAESLVNSALYIALGLAFGGFVWWRMGETSGLEYLTGFVVEKSLAIDNVFVIALIFSAFAIPQRLQHRVLFWGVLGVLVLRGVMIGAGAVLVTRFEWVLYLFAGFLVLTGAKMLASRGETHDPAQGRMFRLLRRVVPMTDGLRGERFFVREAGPDGRMRRLATPLFLALVMVEFADVLFAVDSVPAIFAISTEPFIVYTSNIFAILGLRALYFALAAVLHRFAYLKPALAVLLIFIGAKVFAAPLLGIEKVPPAVSLGVTFAILTTGILWSVWKTGRAPRPQGLGA